MTPTTINAGHVVGHAAAAAGALWFFFALAALAYWFPTAVAAVRNRNIIRVALLNGLLGWTIVGWVCAMFLATRAKPTSTHL